MKFLFLLIALFSISANAGDMFGFDAGVGQSSMPVYGADYEFVGALGVYADLSFVGNREYLQPGASFGIQGKYLNVGIAFSNNLRSVSSNSYSSGHLNIGAELGYMHDLFGPLYIKENNQFMDTSGIFGFSSTISLGFNL